MLRPGHWFREAKVLRETAMKAADALSTDANSLLAGLATKQDLTVVETKLDSRIASLEATMNAKFMVVNIYLIIIGVLSSSSSPLFSGLVHALIGLFH